jgi:hypothetical protein
MAARGATVPKHPASIDAPPGPLRSKKCEPGCATGHCIPVPDEVESAQLLANESRDALHEAGLSDATIEELADDFVAEDRGEDVDVFVAWATYTDWVRRRWTRTSAEHRPVPAHA